MKKIAILGSTGSIGTQTLEVCNLFHSKIQVVGLSTNTNIDLLNDQYKKFKPSALCITDEAHLAAYKKKFGEEVTLYNDLEKFIEALNIDLLVTAIVGAVGLRPTLKAIKKRINIALANKETLVMAGEHVMKLAKANDVDIFPIDSEHSAIWQALRGNTDSAVENIWLTCSGGPFFQKQRNFLSSVTKEQALNHPTWKMGGKISIDSATLMNKGLEVIEAYHLFDLLIEKIKVVIHPQSVIHSIIEYNDGNFIAQMGAADMRIPIQYALFYPERHQNNFKRINFQDLNDLTFALPDMETFSPLKLAYQTIKEGGIMPTLLNAANEVLVNNFLMNKIRFIDILYLLERYIEQSKNIKEPSLEQILIADQQARKDIINMIS